jgi:peptidoglycan/xylan/chitin deacetylase (PgdA/CDA1 family)
VLMPVWRTLIYALVHPSLMRQAAFTVDVDRDVNLPIKGRVSAVSSPRGGVDAPRFSASEEGLQRIVAMLDSLGIEATFFLEGETAVRLAETNDLPTMFRGHEVACHGWAHEDLTGESTGLPLSREKIGEIIDHSVREIERITYQRPLGMRAPYQHVNEVVLEEAARCGVIYDSSITKNIEDRSIGPYRWKEMVEVPVARGRDKRGRPIVSYLWPMHEGDRAPADYRDLLSQYDKGMMVLATHSWHVMERFGGPLSNEHVDDGMDALHVLLQWALDEGIEFMTIDEYLQTEGPR